MGNTNQRPKDQNNIIPLSGNGKNIPVLAPRNMQEAIQFSELLSRSTFIPDTYKNKQGDVLAAVIMGAELGLAPMQSLQNIAVINGRPSVWGDALLALVINSPLCEYIKEEFDDENHVAICRAKRRGREEIVRTFSWKEACQAGLSSKKGPWQAYPKRMLQQRARGFALRDAFPDVLRGLITREEALDYDVEVKHPPKPDQVSTVKPDQASTTKHPETVIDAEVEEVSVNEETPNDQSATGPGLGDFLNGITRTKTSAEMERHVEGHRPLWVEAHGEGSKELALLESAYEQHKQRLQKRGK